MVIDEDKGKVESLIEKYDVSGVVGNGACLDIQREAGVRDAKIVIALTNSDVFAFITLYSFLFVAALFLLSFDPVNGTVVQIASDAGSYEVKHGFLAISQLFLLVFPTLVLHSRQSVRIRASQNTAHYPR